MKAVVVGGGVIGLCIAAELVQRDIEVTVVERGRCGGSTSFGNAGWITPALTAPVPRPGALRQALIGMLRGGGPIAVQRPLSLDLLRWCWDFSRHSSSERFLAGSTAMVEVSRGTAALFDRLQAIGVDFEMHRSGLLFLGMSDNGVRPVLEALTAMERLGCDSQVTVLDHDAVREVEPAVGSGVRWGMLAKNERFLQPETFTNGLVTYLRGAGAEILEGVAVRKVAPKRERWSVRGQEAEFSADVVVIAAGLKSRKLLRELGVLIPLQGVKGYSVTAPTGPGAPRRPLYMTEGRMGCSPFDGSVRLAGLFELGASDTSVDLNRITDMIGVARNYLGEWEPKGDLVTWAGLRSLTPDGLPVLGRVPGFDGLHVATGHGMVGITLAPATAALIADGVVGGRGSEALTAFRVDRFGAKTRRGVPVRAQTCNGKLPSPL